MRKSYDFSQSRRAKDIPLLAKLREKAQDKSRVTTFWRVPREELGQH